MIEIWTDGGAAPNPGVGAYAFIVVDGRKEIYRESGYVGANVTNNVCEATAILRAVSHVGGDVIVYSDSQLLIYQLNGIYRVRNTNLKKLHTAIGMRCMDRNVEFKWNSRETKWTSVCDSMCDAVISRY